jgi:hypothetical protein
MSINEPRPFHAADDWAVVIQSVPSKSKKEIVKRLVEIFELDKRDAEQILSNVPLMFLDNISFGLAVRVKKYFQKLGAVAETTNHDVIKKNCMQVLWPQAPDLSYFMKNELGPMESHEQEAAHGAKPSAGPLAGEKETGPEMPKIHKGSPFIKQEPEASLPPIYPPIAPKPVQESAASLSPFATPTEKPKPPSLSGSEADRGRQDEALNEKLRKIDLEKQLLQTQHAAAIETLRRQLEAEKKKTAEVAQAYDALQKESQKQGAAFQEIEKWQAKVAGLEEKVRFLEKSLSQKQEEASRQAEEWRVKLSGAEEKIRQLEQELSQRQAAPSQEREAQSAQTSALEEKVRALENELTQKTAEFEQTTRQKESILQQFETAVSQAHQEIAGLRDRERSYVQTIEGLEKNIQQMTESLRYRDQVLAEFEKQITELAKITLPPEAGSAEGAR